MLYLLYLFIRKIELHHYYASLKLQYTFTTGDNNRIMEETSLLQMTWTRGYKTSSCSTQLSTKFIRLINVKMPTAVGILTFMSRINTTSEILKAKQNQYFQHFSFYDQLKCYDLGARNVNLG